MSGLIWLVCAILFYGIIKPIKMTVSAVTWLFLMVACASGAYIMGSFMYGCYLGLNQ